jgi:hypothetical protein
MLDSDALPVSPPGGASFSPYQPQLKELVSIYVYHL